MVLFERRELKVRRQNGLEISLGSSSLSLARSRRVVSEIRTQQTIVRAFVVLSSECWQYDCVLEVWRLSIATTLSVLSVAVVPRHSTAFHCSLHRPNCIYRL